MNKLVLSKDVLELTSERSKGLITGLKKLAEFNFSFEYSFKDEPVLKQICINEGIVFTSESSVKSETVYIMNGSEVAIYIKDEMVSSFPYQTFTDVADYIQKTLRSSKKERVTKETKISLALMLDGSGNSTLNTGIGFFDHMLDQIARHANLDLELSVEGDLEVDEHHTVEDVGIALGEAVREALGDKKGIQRYGFKVPMDDCVAECAIDLGGRGRLLFEADFQREKVGEFPTELVEEFFNGISAGLKANIYIAAEGKNEHHKIESIFKSFAKALNEACRYDERNNGRIPSTKGTL